MPGRGRRARPGVPAGGALSPEPPLVLVVDDDEAIRVALERALRLEGFAVCTAADGAEALDAAAAATPAAIVLDVVLPDLDGRDVAQRLRADGVDTPICILSARDEVADRVAGLQAGADDYLVKPFAMELRRASAQQRVRADPARVRPPLAPVEQRISDLRRDVALVALAGLLACALAVRWVAARALLPLQRLRQSGARVSGTHDLTARLDAGAGPEEVDDVARSLNAMLARLEESLAAARRFTADAGHELRTPLTSLRANLATLAPDDLPAAERARVLTEAEAGQDRLAALLDGLQSLARGDAGAAERHVALDLAIVAQQAALHGGRAHASASALGGARLKLELGTMLG